MTDSVHLIRLDTLGHSEHNSKFVKALWGEKASWAAVFPLSLSVLVHPLVIKSLTFTLPQIQAIPMAMPSPPWVNFLPLSCSCQDLVSATWKGHQGPGKQRRCLFYKREGGPTQHLHEKPDWLHMPVTTAPGSKTVEPESSVYFRAVDVER